METNNELELIGNLTEKVKIKSKELLGYEISQTELDLIMLIQTLNVNGFSLQSAFNEKEEITILHKWVEAGYIVEDVKKEGNMKITKAFWDITSEIVYLGYFE